MTAPLPLEDSAADIVGKAMRGLSLNDAGLAARAGLEAAAVQALRNGFFDEKAARAVAPVLGLGADALAATGAKSWRPQAVEVAGLVTFTTPFEDMTVNSYLAFDRASGEAVAFDTGADCTAMLDFLRRENLSLPLILITHTHPDHIADLARLQRETGANIFTGTREPADGARTFDEGRTFDCGALHLETRLTWGHCKGGITYVIHVSRCSAPQSKVRPSSKGRAPSAGSRVPVKTFAPVFRCSRARSAMWSGWVWVRRMSGRERFSRRRKPSIAVQSAPVSKATASPLARSKAR